LHLPILLDIGTIGVPCGILSKRLLFLGVELLLGDDGFEFEGDKLLGVGPRTASTGKSGTSE
jgi:hypothetical protein